MNTLLLLFDGLRLILIEFYALLLPSPLVPMTKKSEWATNQHRDTYASHIGHFDSLMYFSVAQNDSIGRLKSQFLEVSFFSLVSFSQDSYVENKKGLLSDVLCP